MSKVRSLELGVWSLEFGVWSLEFGVWSLELGVRSLEFGVIPITSEVAPEQFAQAPVSPSFIHFVRFHKELVLLKSCTSPNNRLRMNSEANS
ncbi:MAG: hypothetical protein V7L11_08540 [Nostoc sp.]|uniref:hypothetical protein n=1 Tax=Nostoc sp. TaxID=1180 RepID=UPI002FFAB366